MKGKHPEFYGEENAKEVTVKLYKIKPFGCR